jgi:glycosyltransferase involved in cell wall biosynthesis
MKIDLSICIPTMNRPDYLLIALESIINQKNYNIKVEICISNNASKEDYTRVEALINNQNLNGISINYYIQENRVSLDPHMHYVTNMAVGEYIYYLGDDDYFHDDALIIISDLIYCKKVDLAIFNGDTIDSEGVFLGRSFNETARSYSRISEAFLDLKGKSTFGAVLVKRKYIENLYFEGLYGGSHAYTCFWVPMLNNMECIYNIVVPEEPVVFLRKSEKSYNFVKVYYTDIPNHHIKFKALLNTEFAKKLIDERSQIILNETKSIRFKVALLRKGTYYSELPSDSFQNKLVNIISCIIAMNVVYKPIKYINKLFNERGAYKV